MRPILKRSTNRRASQGHSETDKSWVALIRAGRADHDDRPIPVAFLNRELVDDQPPIEFPEIREEPFSLFTRGIR
jgi:hypothetical protein